MATKSDAATEEQIGALRKAARSRREKFFALSGAAHQGLEPFVRFVGIRLEDLKREAGA